MQMSGNTILITGGGSGIGLGLADAFHARDNKVIIAGRTEKKLKAAAAEHPGMEYATVDVADADDVKRFAHEINARFGALNVLVNNAGIMKMERIVDADASTAESIIAINLLGPIRLTAALLPTLRRQAQSAVINVSSGLAFVPMAATPTYSATKSALHAYSDAMRHQLKDTTTQVIEIAPPYVQTYLTGEHQATDERAMPLSEFIAEVMSLLESDPAAAEIIVKRCEPIRYAREHGTYDDMFATINEAFPV